MIRTVVASTLFMLAGLVSCGTLETAPVVSTPSRDAASKLHGVAVADLDRRVDPCTDFFAFANGAWMSANPIPEGAERWSRRAVAREANQKKIEGLLEEMAATKERPSGGAEQIIGDYYASCVDEAGVDAAGLTPLSPRLAEIEEAHTVADVQRMIRRMHEIAIPVPFGLSGAPDYHDPRKLVATLVAGSLGMPNRDDYLKPEPPFVDAREKYRARVARVLQLAGVPGEAARNGAEAVLALETRLAAASLDSAAAADPVATDHVMTFAQLEALAPAVGWPAYFDEAKLPRVDLVVAEPKLLEQIDKELKETPVAVWKSYLTWHLLDSASPWLSKAFVDANAAEKKPRATLCAESTDALFPDAVGKVYVERYFPPAAKTRVEGVIGSMMAVLKDDVAHVEWMQPETRKRALEKLATYSALVGYPDRWKSYASVTIRRETLWANIAAARRFNVDDNRDQIGKPTAAQLWQLPSSSTALAYLDLQLNEIVLPAGFLQWPQFDSEANDAVVYGAVGAGVAHDMTHGIDADGSTVDPFGRPIPWWSDADRKEFGKRSQCVIDQVEAFEIEPGLRHRGKVVLNEAIGDLAGIRIAYLAFEKSLARHPVPVVDGFTPEQQFFLSAAQARAEEVRVEAERRMVEHDPHPVSKFRVNGTFANTPAFQQAFACKAGAAMVRPAEQRCSVW
jgi:putative endopeptidase